MVATTKRHPAIVRHRTGVTRDGRLDGDGHRRRARRRRVRHAERRGAVARRAFTPTGPYRCDHIRIRGRAMMTNTPPNGAFRGFGAPQTQFAVEVHMDRIAEQLGTGSGSRCARSTRCARATRPRPASGSATTAARCTVLREAVKRTDFKQQARRALTGTNRGHRPVAVLSRLGLHRRRRGASSRRRRRSRSPTAGARILVAAPRSARARGRCTRRSSPTRSACRTTAIEVERSRHRRRARQRADGRVAHLHGRRPDPAAVRRGDARAARRAHAAAVSARARPARRHRRSTSRRLRSSGTTTRYSGDAYGSYGWGCDVVEVEVDRDTWRGAADRVHGGARDRQGDPPALARGQIEGGSAQGLGYALLEEVVMRDGAMANAQLTNYIIPTTLDTPAMDVVMLENPYPRGPFGAKGRRRDADRRPGAGGRQRAAACRLRRARDSGDARRRSWRACASR